jgi:pimeloyl-ACP methyl ester carboxylesterase
MTVDQRTAQVNGITINYVAHLHEKPRTKTIVLVHGWPHSLHGWHRIIGKLAAKYNVLALDVRGVGGSSAPAKGYDKRTLASDVHALVTHLGLRDVYVVGHDLGGLIAYAYARQFPSETSGAVNLDMPIPGIAGWDVATASYPAWHFGFHQGTQKGVGVAEQLVAGREAFYFRSFIDRVAGHPDRISDADVEVYAAAYRAPEKLKAGFEWYRTFGEDAVTNSSDVGPIAVPILLSFGELSNAPLMEVIAQGLRDVGAKDVRTNVIKNSGHWPADEQPEQVVSILSTFVDSIELRA